MTDSYFSHVIASLVLFYANSEVVISETHRILQIRGGMGFMSFSKYQCSEWMDLRNVVKNIYPALDSPLYMLIGLLTNRSGNS